MWVIAAGAGRRSRRAIGPGDATASYFFVVERAGGA